MNTPHQWAIASLSLAVAFAAAGSEPSHTAGHGADPAAHQTPTTEWKRSPLVDRVRKATYRYLDVNVAIGEGWVLATPCVSGPNEGAMGLHFVLPSRVGDGRLDADEPEALIYEPLRNGALRLVGVEFIVIAEDWTGPDAPAVDGHLTHYVGAPNRYGLPAFHELHVWAWAHNPQGNFADWNKRVSCDAYIAQYE